MAERRRILLAEIKPSIPGSKTYATWNPADKSVNVTLASGNLVAFAGATTFGAARATLSVRAGQWYWETVYTTFPAAGFVMAAGVGVADAGSLTDGQFGFHNVPILTQSGPRTTNGDCYTASTLTGTVGTVAAGNRIGHWYDADSGTYRVRKNGGAWIVLLPRRPKFADDAWFPMLQVSRNGRITANFGASAFIDPVPHGVNAGVYSVAAPSVTSVYLGSEGFNTEAADVKASTHFDGRIARDVDLETGRGVRCWVWGGQTRSSRGQLSIIATDGALDGWRGWLWRDAEVRLLQGYEGDDYGAFVERSKERVENYSIGEKRMTLQLRDQLSQLDVALPRPMYNSKVANAQLVHTPAHVVLGRPLFCEGALRTTSSLGNDAFAFDLSDGQVRIDAIYDRGDIFPAIPANWVYTQDGIGFKLTNDPDEPVVANPAGPWKLAVADTITGANGGDFLTWAGTPPVPSGWTQLGTAWVVANRFLAGVPSGARVLSNGAQMVQMYNSGSTLPAGDYRLSFTVAAVTTAGVVCFIAGGVNTYARIDRVGAFSIMLKSGGGQLQFIAGNDGTNVLGALDVTITSLRARAATLIERLSDWVEYLAATLGAQTIDTAAISALQAKADYRLAHFAAPEETILSILRRSLDGWTGWIVPKLNGTLTVGRLELPAAAADFTLTNAQIKRVEVVGDVAKGLTTRMAGRRNHRVHSRSEIADSVPRSLRVELENEYTAIRSAQASVEYLGTKPSLQRQATVSPTVKQADGAPPQPTFLQDADDLQAEAGRVGTLEREQRDFFEIECVLDAVAAESIEPGQTVSVVWPRHGLAAGRNLFVLDVTTRFWSRVVTLTVWG